MTESPSNILRLILTFPNLFFPENKTILQLYVLLLSSSIMLVSVLTIQYIQYSVYYSVFSCKARCHMLFENQPIPYTIYLLLLFQTTHLSIKSSFFLPLVLRWRPFSSSYTRCCWFKWSSTFSLIIPVSNLQKNSSRPLISNCQQHSPFSHLSLLPDFL